MRQLQKDENAISGWGILSWITLIVVIIASWQIIAPTYDIVTPQELLYGETVYEHNLILLDRVTGQKTVLEKGMQYPFDKNMIYQTEFHSYELYLESNAEWRFGDNSWRMVYNLQNVAYLDENSGDLQLVSQSLPISAIWSNQFPLPLNATHSHNAQLEFWLYNPNGNIVSEWDMTLVHVTGYGDFP